MPLADPTLELDSLYKLLPPNATKLERDLLKLIPFDSVLQTRIAEMNAIGETVFPDDWKIWILQERGQLPLLEVLDIDVLIANSIYLVENNGTVAAIIRVATLLGYPNVWTWEQEWPSTQFSEFHIYLGKYPTSQASLEALEKAIKFVKPARCRLRRFFYTFDDDIRRCVLSRLKGKQHGILGRSLLGHFSGWKSAHNPELWINFVEPIVKRTNFGTLVGVEAIEFPVDGYDTMTLVTTDSTYYTTDLNYYTTDQSYAI